ncbi:putative phosphoribosylaminoimidazole carboxylase [Helianthus annuus]|nr:putative phosphoribosylaminoimidazole carboxylase [Helianthus annuus]
MFSYATSARERGMVVALTPLPVIGVPVRASTLDGLDSLLYIVQVCRIIMSNFLKHAIYLIMTVLGIKSKLLMLWYM